MERLEDVIFYKLENAIKSYRQIAQRNISVSGIDLTVDQWLIMNVILGNKNIKQNEIAIMVFKDAASVTRIIDLLIKKNFITRELHHTDQRRALLTLTQSGKKILKKVQVIIKQNRKLAIKGISDNEIKVMSKNLSVIILNCKTE